jgi:hypothetical protein
MVNQFWAFVCEAGFLGWVGCTIGFIYRASGPVDSFHRKRAAFWGILIAIFYGVWLFGMLKA